MRTYEPGIYIGRIVRWALGESKKKGTPQFVITFTVEEKDGQAMDGAERSIFRAITKGTAEYVVKDLRALGYDRNDFDGLDPDAPDAFDFAGLDIKVKLKYEEYEGKEQERWDLAMTGLEVKKLEQPAIKKLNAAFGGLLRGAPKAKAAATPRAAQNNDDESTPF